MFKLILLSLVFVSFSVFAESKTVDCSTILNENVIVIPIHHAQLEMMKASGGSANISNTGRRVIFYDESLDSLPEMKNHVLAHECAHHALDHVKRPTIRNYYANEVLKEHPADCLASKILVQQLGYGKREFDIITNFLSKQFPGGVSRSQRILQCAK